MQLIHLLRRDVEKPSVWLFAAEVRQHPLPVFLAHLRVDRLSLDLVLV